ncbi:hypothetical protein CB0940_08896 [Cercospora beticola]|uniref:Tachykinin family protein n=1 Tax=Cercospora beticola TaxID=122368 RepID=A0A2G5HNP2_CERBT|nr:hypothetical protein CB0940_08896 [Cercospora beticola]PIA94164.1 hypothetical protein CB0940_08896 [Cercospora beticola]WPB05490.1 hypothetical protein RHO25_010142 [Cercospora beticola]
MESASTAAKSISKPEASPTNTWLFVEDGTKPGPARSKQSRAHVARVNRQRQKLKAQALNAAKAGSIQSGSSSLQSQTGTHALPLRYRTNLQAGSAADEEVTRALIERERQTLIARHPKPRPTIPRTIQPVFGGAVIDSFPQQQSVEAAELAQFCFESVFGAWLTLPQKHIWVAAFFRHPLVYHSLSFSCGIIQDFHLRRPIQHNRLLHRGQTIGLVNEALGNLADVDIEPVLLAISTLWRIDIENLGVAKEVPMLFAPHVRNLSWVDLFGKLGGDSRHGQALAQLVRRKKGPELGTFTTLPSLEGTLALADLIDGSGNASKPRFPSIWSSKQYMEALSPALKQLSGDIEGKYFYEHISHGLNHEHCAVYYRLSCVDKLLDDFAQPGRAVSRDEAFFIAELSSAVQHELLSLPSWRDLNPAQDNCRSEVVFESTRMAGILYSNSVVFPVKASDPWLDQLLTQMRVVFEQENAMLGDRDCAPIFVWALFIASMAAYSTPHREFFSALLRRLLHRFNLLSWKLVHPILRGFLWRDSACLQGASTLWKYLAVESAESTPTRHN